MIKYVVVRLDGTRFDRLSIYYSNDLIITVRIYVQYNNGISTIRIRTFA